MRTPTRPAVIGTPTGAAGVVPDCETSLAPVARQRGGCEDVGGVRWKLALVHEDRPRDLRVRIGHRDRKQLVAALQLEDLNPRMRPDVVTANEREERRRVLLGELHVDVPRVAGRAGVEGLSRVREGVDPRLDARLRVGLADLRVVEGSGVVERLRLDRRVGGVLVEEAALELLRGRESARVGLQLEVAPVLEEVGGVDHEGSDRHSHRQEADDEDDDAAALIADGDAGAARLITRTPDRRRRRAARAAWLPCP